MFTSMFEDFLPNIEELEWTGKLSLDSKVNSFCFARLSGATSRTASPAPAKYRLHVSIQLTSSSM